jgi:hypothetical protein
MPELWLLPLPAYGDATSEARAVSIGVRGNRSSEDCGESPSHALFGATSPRKRGEVILYLFGSG